MTTLRVFVSVALLAWAAMLAHAADELLANGDFEGGWRPLTSNWDTGTAEGEVPEGWEDVSTWSGASTRYARVPGPEARGHALRLEMVSATERHSVLQLRCAFPVEMQEGKAYAVTGRLRSPTGAPVTLAIRQHQEPRLRFWETRLPGTPQWREFRYVIEPTDSGEARFFLTFREVGVVEVDDLSVVRLDEDDRPPPQPPAPILAARCVKSRDDLIRHSDIIAMYQEGKPETLRKYLIDVVAWGGQLYPSADKIAERRELLQMAHEAGVRLHAVDCALVQEGGRCVVCGGDRSLRGRGLFWQLRKDNEATLAQLAELGIDLTRDTVLDVDGQWVPVPWLRKRWRIPMASVYSPVVRRWFFEQMDAIAETGATALHFDEPAMGANALRGPNPGDFSQHAMTAFRDWLRERPEEVWREAGVDSLDGFNYRDSVLEHGGNPTAAPLWREFVRFQLFTTRDLVRELRDRVRAKLGRDIPLSMNANASSWIKLPLLELQDFMTTEVAHEAKSRKPPIDPLLAYKLGDAFRQPVASTAHGHDWYQMKSDQHPVLVCTWLAMGYALGHQLMMPCKAWVMDPVTGSDSYRPTSDHYACVARFIKEVAPLLDGHEAVSALAVVLGCDAIEHDRTAVKRLVQRLAEENIPFSMAVEGNDLLERRVTAEDLEGCAAVLIACPAHLTDEAKQRIGALAGDRPVAEHYGGGPPGCVPRPIIVDGADGVWVLPRAVPGDPTAPVAIHLLNRDYDPDRHAMQAKGPFTITLDSRLFPGRSFSGAALRRPVLLPELPAEEQFDFAPTVELEIERNGGQIELSVPHLELWGIIELS